MLNSPGPSELVPGPVNWPLTFVLWTYPCSWHAGTAARASPAFANVTSAAATDTASTDARRPRQDLSAANMLLLTALFTYRRRNLADLGCFRRTVRRGDDSAMTRC